MREAAVALLREYRRGGEGDVGVDGVIGGGSDRCVPGSALVDGEAQWRRGPHQRYGAKWSYYLLCPPGSGGMAAYSVDGKGGDEKGSCCE